MQKCNFKVLKTAPDWSECFLLDDIFLYSEELLFGIASRVTKLQF